MERIIVTVNLEGQGQARDLELPAGLQASQLAQAVASALNWDRLVNGSPIQYQIQAEPPGRLLNPAETLEMAGIGDGARLFFSPAGTRASNTYSQNQSRPTDATQATNGNPVIGWRSLDLGIDPTATNSGPEPDPTPSTSKFAWKELKF